MYFIKLLCAGDNRYAVAIMDFHFRKSLPLRRSGSLALFQFNIQ